MKEFIEKHKIPLILLGVSLGVWALFEYLSAQASANSNSDSSDATDAYDQAQQAALQDELASLQQGSSGSTSSPIASSPAVSGLSTTPTSTSTGTAATAAAGGSPSGTTTASSVSGTSTYSNDGGNSVAPSSGNNYSQTVPDVTTSGQIVYPGGGTSNPNAVSDAAMGPAAQGPTDQLAAEIQAGNPQAIALMNQYNGMLQESDPQLYSSLEATGIDPYLSYLEQQGGDVQTANEAGLNPSGQSNTILPTFNLTAPSSGNQSESSGGESSSAGAGGASSATAATIGARSNLNPALAGQVAGTPSSNVPGGLTAGGSTVRQLTTVTPSGQKAPTVASTTQPTSGANAVTPQPVKAPVSTIATPVPARPVVVR